MNKWIIFAFCIIGVIGLWFHNSGTCPLLSLFQNKVEANPGYQKITAAQVKELLDKGDKLTILDVRTKSEYADGHIPGSHLLPFDEIKDKTDQLPQDKNEALILYCRSGRRTAIAAKTLLSLGYTKIYDMGAISTWKYGLEK